MNTHFEEGKYYRTRLGKKAYVSKIVMFPDETTPNYPITGAVWNKDRAEWIFSCWSLDGLVFDNKFSDADLMEEWHEPFKKVGYINIYDDGSIGILQDSRAEADGIQDLYRKRVGCQKIVIEEGIWDD